MLSNEKRACISEYEEPEGTFCRPKIKTPLAFDSALMNHSIPACDSFYGSMCGRWVADHTNEDRAFTYGYRRNKQTVQRLIESVEPLKNFYTSCVNRKQNSAESAIELRHVLEHILAPVRSYADLPVAFARLAKLGYTSPFTLIIDRHPRDPLRLPLLAYDDGFDHLNATDIPIIYTQARLSANLNALQVTTHAQRAQNAIAILKSHCTKKLSSIDNFDLYVKEQFQFDYVKGGVQWKNWPLYLSTLDGNALQFSSQDQSWWIVDRAYFEWLFNGGGIETITVLEWRAYIEFSILYNSHQFVPVLPSDVYYKRHNRYGPTGKEGRIYHRLKRRETTTDSTPSICAEVTEAMLPGLVAREFIAREFPAKEDTKREALDMIGRIKSAMAARVVDGRLKGKIDAIIPRVLEPNRVWDVEPFADRISPDRYDHNMNMIRRYRVQQNLALWHKDKPGELDRNGLAYFAMPTTDINAYYSPHTNTITILGGLLQPPFYLPSYGQVSKHAILGVIIGHELAHAIDNEGIMWDERGGYNAVISSEDMSNRVSCLKEDFALENNCGVDPDTYSTRVIGEALSDLVGLRAAYDSYFLLYNTSATMGDKQHFFMVFAQLWCESYDDARTCDSIRGDAHPLGKMRVDQTLRNVREFQVAFGCRSTKQKFCD